MADTSNTVDPTLLEKGRLLFAGECEFVLGVAQLEQLPPSNRAEIAFAGRSNVGKSSLINALTNRKTLARTSNTPGRTQQLNFFDLSDQIYLVDMPGYGYAKVSKKQRQEWDDLIFDYLQGRPMLRCVFILIDGRHGIKDTDEDLMKMLDEAAVSYRIVLTKCDKSKASEFKAIKEKLNDILIKHPAAYPEMLETSSLKSEGLSELRAVIAGMAE